MNISYLHSAAGRLNRVVCVYYALIWCWFGVDLMLILLLYVNLAFIVFVAFKFSFDLELQCIQKKHINNIKSTRIT